MKKTLHPLDDVDRLYVSRKERGRGHDRIENSMNASIQQIEVYLEKHEEGRITANRNDTDNKMANRMTITRKQKWEEKQHYERFKQIINNISLEKTWIWPRIGNFKRETESLQIATQNNAIKTNHIKATLDKTQ